MKILFIFFVSVCLYGVEACGGVWDYFAYDEQDRNQVDKLDVLAAVKINKSFAFADLGLVKTVVKEVEKNEGLPMSDGPRGAESLANIFGSEIFFHSDPVANSRLQLIRNTLWLFEVEITEVLDGVVETNCVFVAMRPTRAFSRLEEGPSLWGKFADAQLILGLVRLDDEEFKKSFRGLVCYVKNDPRFFNRSNFTDPLDGCVVAEGYELFFVRSEFSPSPCYVVRDVGLQSETETKYFGRYKLPVECGLMKAFREKKEEEAAEKKAKGEAESAEIPGLEGSPISADGLNQANMATVAYLADGSSNCGHSHATVKSDSSAQTPEELSAVFIEQYQAEAETGDGCAAYRLYRHYKTVDAEKAGFWLAKAVELNDSGALYETGRKAMDEGRVAAGMDGIARAAALGSFAAANYIRHYYLWSKDSPAYNPVAGVELLNQAFEKGNDQAGLLLGEFYSRTKELKWNDLRRAEECYLKVASGNSRSAFSAWLALGNLYARPDIARYEEAAKWLKKTAETKSAPKFINRRIASVLLRLPDRRDEAILWLKKGVAENDPTAVRMLKELETGTQVK